MTNNSDPQHSLVLGGTGMLAETTRWLAERSKTTLLVSPTATRFASGSSKLIPLELDWTTHAFRADLMQALQTSPPITHALLWIHDGPTIAWLLPLLPRAFIVLVLGCLDGDPDVPDDAKSVVTVRLGSKADKPTGRRWLTNEEISNGAILAFTTSQPQVVGELRPA